MAANSEQEGHVSEIYDRTWEIYLDRSRRSADLKEWLNQNILDILTVVKTDQKQFNVLSVGCSHGEKDMIVLKHLEGLLKKDEEVNFAAVEPDSSAVEKFEKRVKETYRSMNFTKHVMTFEDFRSRPGKDQNTFDLLLLIHCMYYMKAEEDLLHCFNNELKENGAILCLVQDKGSAYIKLHDKLHEWNQNPPLVYYSTDDLVKIAEKYGWKYNTFKFNYDVDATECFDESSEDGQLLLDFLVHLPDFRNDTSLYKDIMEELKKITFENADGKKIFRAIAGGIVIYK